MNSLLEENKENWPICFDWARTHTPRLLPLAKDIFMASNGVIKEFQSMATNIDASSSDEEIQEMIN